MFKDKLIKKFSERHFKNKSRHSFATHVKSVDFVITSFLNNINQLIMNNENEKDESIKVSDTFILRSDTIMSFL